MANPPNKLILTRNQLASFVGDDPRAIKQLEKLFELAQAVQSVDVDSITFDAGAALAGVDKLAGIVAQLAQDEGVEGSNALAIAQAAERALVAVEALAMVGATLPPPVPNRGRTTGGFGAIGAFHDSTSQSPAVINTAYPVTLTSTDVSLGVWRDSVNTSRVYVADAGVYNFQTTLQLDKVGGGAPQIWIWCRVDGVDVPDSASLVHLQGAADECVFACNWFLSMKANGYFELVWASDDTGSRLAYFPAAAPVPAIPSVILTVSQEG